MMDYLILILSVLGIVGCYEIATRMTLQTRHSMRLAVIVIGLGCVAAMLGERDTAIVILLTGCGLYRLFDLRTGGVHARTDSGGLRAVATEPNQHTRCTDEFAASPRHAVGGGMPVPPDRQNHDVRAAA